LTWVIGGPISGWLLDHMHGWAGLAGWKWLFLLEGMPTVILGGVTLFFLTDRPAQASWLTAAERAWLIDHLAAEEQGRQHHHGGTLRQLMEDRRLWHLVALASTIALGISGLAYFFAPLVKDRFGKLDSFEIGLLKAVAGTCTLLAVIVVGSHSDRKGERRWHVACAGFVAAAGWGLSTWREVPLASYLGMIVAQAAMMSMWGPFWSLATTLLGSRAAAGGIAFINAIANLGAYFGPVIMGRSEEAGDFTFGLAVMGLTLIVGGVLALLIARPD
jgi:MFS transporter, ACS family, tartrate transporter